MFDTNIVIIGNVLTAPEWRRTTNTGSLVANFKVASTARRLDRETGRWVDGNTLRVRVNCWRKLAEGVASSVMVGDPVVVAGRLYTRDWTDADGNPRTMYEMEAVAIGHDLARGRSSFRRNRPTLGTSAVEDSEAEEQVHGAPAEHLAEEEIPVRYGDGIVDEERPGFDEVPPSGPDEHDPMVVIRGGGFAADDTADDASRPAPEPAAAPRRQRRPAAADDGPAATGPAATGPAATGPGVTRPAASGPTASGPATTGSAVGEPGPAVGADGAEPPPSRPRRSGRRIPVPA